MHAALEAVLKRAFAAAAGVDLAFHHHALMAFAKQFFDCRLGFLNRGGRFAGGDWHAVAPHKFFGLIFVQIHG